ncbi:hypothetical protein IW261DRAFT_1470989 [Armillaria novae-zelandiae]|uniref:DRBM domain-containing protein n=1 Tax=Armillaria novae-zelandiae TaxID=153914 RepID=A0AA39PC54_9AGAR|nr:hypothetical protein IW261DRAFT_1470989 [Armillaria novae-zelandiae]
MPSNRGTVELNNYLQSKGMLASLSWIESISDPRYGPTWTCICKIDGQVRGIGTGAQKHVARDIAASQALNTLIERHQ